MTLYFWLAEEAYLYVRLGEYGIEIAYDHLVAVTLDDDGFRGARAVEAY